MTLAVFDLGGSAVKYGLWDQEKLQQTGSFPTPKTYEELKQELAVRVNQFKETSEVVGVAFSMPGVVNVQESIIEGISAIPYIHGFDIFKDLETFFDLPITIENDANCAGICEVEVGAGQGVDHLAFLVLGTGVGGSLFINRELYKGAHLFSGEFGLMKLEGNKIFSTHGTAVSLGKRYSKEKQVEVSGEQVFLLADQGDLLAQKYVDELYHALAKGLYNIQVSLDPSRIILGGGMSKRKGLALELTKRVFTLLEKEGITTIKPDIRAAEFFNDANLIGAALNFNKVIQ
ncbi:ROK family protein [Vagococcus humatus]|uniref:ROK family protein n=1 Tax=Vagococcus humatus TaxID=1889241 RepID=A0A429Z9Q0_9ENTE|nr:ROK family protein [Vagococcus humatus]RST90421.1 ROK family protein [Vagococcus humatus]